jgi:alkylhydroperoxidase family enzyme
MAWIRTIGPDEAQGRLRDSYAAACQRAGRVYEIVRAMSLAPEILDASMNLYLRVMKGASPLTRAQREMLAVVTSRANDCHY